ncbi:uncharacterized protein LOC110252499 [Paramuricea clavata]|uniref:Uncharacterized protein LOC110252499 n=1 Tax=Paramuricea clavata TaxID=317549 RepID=A0A6S7GWB2_PARCT|nr:uncharacterized protein LOC110252499 [Paramuricea clavata]
MASRNDNDLARIISEAVTVALRQTSNERNVAATSTSNNETRGEVIETNINDENEVASSVSAPPIGRPRKSISREQLESLLSLRLPISEVAWTLGVSRPTIYTFMKEHNIPYEGRFTGHSEEHLRHAVTAIKQDFPNSGEHGIDGFSRLVTFGKFSTNNRAATVLQVFRGAVERYGHPVKIRTDHGGENVEIWRYMVETHGEDSHPAIVGSSVHNQRIERDNRAVNEQLVSTFKMTFYSLERQGLLDPSNCTDLFCLHYVFLPRLNKSLSQFIAAHNNHTVSTEENKSPLQMFCQNRHLTALHSEERHNLLQGNNVSRFLESPGDTPYVEVNDVTDVLDEHGLHQLQQVVDPLSDEDSDTLYRRAIQFVGNYLTSQEEI